MDSRPFIVEFTGARGAGKSTLFQLVQAEFDRREIAINQLDPLSRVARIYLRISSLIDRIRSTFTWLTWRPTSFAMLQTFRKRFRYHQIRTLRIKRGSGLFVLDEGMFQLMLRLHACTALKDMGRISASLRKVAVFPDLVILVRASEEDIEARRKMRANRGDLLKPKVSPRGRLALKSLEEYLLSSTASSAGTTVFAVDNLPGVDPAETASKIVDEIIRKSGAKVVTTEFEPVSPPITMEVSA